MRKEIIVCVIGLLLLMLNLCGCTEESKFEGTWKSQLGITYVFKSDGDLIVGGAAGSWEVRDGKLVLKTPDEIE